MRLLLWLWLSVCMLCCPVLAQAKQYRVLVVPTGERVQYWQWVKQGALQAAKERGIKLIYRGPRTSDDHGAQRSILSKSIEDNVDAIVLAPIHEAHAEDLLLTAVRKGIPVIIIDTELKFDGRTSFIGSDNLQAGKRAADYLFSLLDSESHVLLLRYKAGRKSTMGREQGFLDAASASSGGYHVLDAGYVGVSIGDAYYATLRMFKKNPDIKGVFSPGEATTLGVLKALQHLSLAGRVKVVGFDYTQKLHTALDRGVLNGTMIQDPYSMGYQGVIAACDVLDGKKVPARVVTETKLVTDVSEVPAVVVTHGDKAAPK